MHVYSRVAVWMLAACRADDATILTADSRVILEAHLSHGIGDSPFDSPLVHDSIAAEMIVRAGQCPPAESLRAIHSDTAEGALLLEQLQADGLVVMHEQRACTTFPILINEARTRYAAIASGIAEDATRELAADLAAILRLLGEKGWTDWQYHFLWSQLFDSQFAWTGMMQRGLVPPLARLVAWVVYPAHPLRSGTNYYPDTELRDYWLLVTWRPDAANTVGLVGGAWKVLYQVALEGKTLTPPERDTLADLDLLNEAGTLQVPVLQAGDSLLDLLQQAADRYIDFLERNVPLDDLIAVSRVDRQHTFAMVYHDITWGILDRLVHSGKISIPPALESGTQSPKPSMRGVTALTPVHPAFADLIRAAIEGR